MNCTINQLNNTLQCGNFVIAGIKKIQLIPFGAIYDYTYTNDNLNIITGYKLSSIPIELKTFPESVYTGNYSINNFRFFSGVLDTRLDEISDEKRNELEAIIRLDLSIIIEDRMGRCWLMGQEKPVKVSKYEFGTGTKDGYNGYKITFSEESRHQIRQISCFDKCFASFDGAIYIQSAFAIENASSFSTPSGTYLQISNGVSLLTYTTLTAMDMTLWGTNTIQTLNDKSEIDALLNGDGVVSQLIYDSGLDRAIIIIQSTTHSFNSYSIDFTPAANSIVNVSVNLTLTLATGLDDNPNTIVTVRDGDNTIIYQGHPDLFLGVDYSGIGGFVRDAWVNASNLYPMGTTFTAEVNGFDCETRSYTFTLPPISNCGFETEYTLHLGRTYSAHIPYIEPAMKYRRTIINLDGYQYEIARTISSWGDDFSSYQSEIETALTTYPNDSIDYSTLLIEDTGTGTSIKFQIFESAYDELHPFDAFVIHFAVTGDTYTKTAFLPTNDVNLLIQTSSDSTISIEDFASNEITGVYGNAPTSFGSFYTETIPDVSVGEIQDIAFDLNEYNYDQSTFIVTSESETCPTVTGETEIVVATGGSEAQFFGVYKLFNISVGGNTTTGIGTGVTFEFDDNGFKNFVFPDNVYFDAYIDNFTSTINAEIGGYAKIVGMWYSVALVQWFLEIICTNDNLLSVTSDIGEWDLLENENVKLNFLFGDAGAYYHPNQDAHWDFTGFFGGGFTGESQMKNQLIIDNQMIENYVSMEYSGGSLIINTPNHIAPMGTLGLTFYDDYPTIGNFITQYAINEGDTITIKDIDTDSGGLTSTIKYVRIGNLYRSHIYAYDPASNVNVEVFFDEQILMRDVWGRFYGIYAFDSVNTNGYAL